MSRVRILKASGIIDFYVDKFKYESYKTRNAQFRYVHRELTEILFKLNKTQDCGLEVRDLSITSNHFWGIFEFCFVNDLNYSASNKVAKNEEKLTIRLCEIDCIFLIIEEEYNIFPIIKGESFHLMINISTEI